MPLVAQLGECATWTLFATALSFAAPAANADTLKEKVVGTWSAVSQSSDSPASQVWVG
jgi:hypothetical protein